MLIVLFKFLKNYLWIFLGGGVVFLISRFSGIDQFFKMASNTFIVGRSSVKVYVFIIYLFILWKIFYAKAIFKKNIFFLHASLTGLLFLLGVFEFLSFYVEVYGYDFRFLNHLFSVYDPPFNVSSTALLHTHNAKAIFAWPLSRWFGAKYFYLFNPGAPFLDFYPDWLLITHLALYVLYIILSFQLLFSLKAKLDIGSFSGFGLAILVITKNLTDGGLFNHEAWLFGMPLYLLFGIRATVFPEGQAPKIFLSFGGVVFLFYISYLMVLNRIGVPTVAEAMDLISSLMRYCLAFAIMSGAAFLHSRIHGKDNDRALMLCLGAFLLFCVLFQVVPVNLSKNFYRTENYSLAKNSVIVATARSPEVFKRLEREKGVSITEMHQQENYLKVRMWLDKDMSYNELCEKIGMNPNWGPVSLAGGSCVEENTLFFEEECFVTPFTKAQELVLPHGFQIEVSAPGAKRNIRGRDFYKQKIGITLPGCTPMLATARLNIMKTAGIQKAICSRHPLQIFKIPEKYMLSGEVE